MLQSLTACALFACFMYLPILGRCLRYFNLVDDCITGSQFRHWAQFLWDSVTSDKVIPYYLFDYTSYFRQSPNLIVNFGSYNFFRIIQTFLFDFYRHSPNYLTTFLNILYKPHVFPYGSKNIIIDEYGHTNERCMEYTIDDVRIGSAFAVMLSVVYAMYLYQLVYPLAYDYYRSILMYYCSTTCCKDLRQNFRYITTLDFKRGLPGQHSHPEAAHGRTVANDIIDAFCQKSSLNRYDFMTSASVSKSSSGSRFWYFMKDASQIPKWEPMPSNPLITMIDVDYYVDLPRFLTGDPVCLYTFTPSGVASTTTNGDYWFDEDSVVTLQVHGGASYTHKLWNFDVDDLTIDHWWGSVVYIVESIKLGLDRRLVLLNPIRKIYGPLGYFLPGRRLQRRSVVAEGVARVRVGSDIVMSKSGSRSQIVIPENALETARIRLASSLKPHISDVERIFAGLKVDDHVHAATIFYSIYNSYVPPVNSNITLRDLHSFQAVGKLLLEDGKPSMRPLATPMMQSFAPVKSYNNDLACINGRLDAVRNSKPCPKECIGYREDFVHEILVSLQVKNSLVPLDFETYRDRLKNSTSIAQRMDGQEVFLLPSDRVRVSAFQKAEAYASVTAPRNISTLPASHNFRLGQFVYVLADYLKRLPWYGPGRHPTDLSRRVLEIATQSLFLNNTDFVKLDGSTSEYVRSVYQLLMERAFAKIHQEEINKLLQAESTAKGYTQNDVIYAVDYTICSGSSDTSQLGSISNAYLQYSSYRSTGLNSTEAYSKLGLYFGDDGLSPDLDLVVQQRCCARHGYLIKSDVIKPGMPLTFLGRLFTNPFGSSESMADVGRQLRKLHLSDCPLSVSTDLILARRALAYLITDPQTPILSEWSRAILRLARVNDRQSQIDIAAREDSYWLFYESPFIHVRYDDALPFVADNLGISCDDVNRIIKILENAKTIAECFPVIKSEDCVVKIDAIVDGQIHIAPALPNHFALLAAAADQTLKYCNDFQRGKCTRVKCKFRHEKEPNKIEEIICKNFKRGKCDFGSKCKFKH